MLEDDGEERISGKEEDAPRPDGVGEVCPRDAVQYPLATVSMDVKGHPIQVVEAVSETLPAAALLDTDVSELVQLLEGRSLGPRKEEEGFLATTRSQARRQKEEEEECRRKEMQSGAQPTALGTEDVVSGQGDEEEGVPEDRREHRALIYSRAAASGRRCHGV